MKISPIPENLVLDVYKNDFDADMVYKRLLDSMEVSDIYPHALTSLLSCMIVQWRLNDTKSFLPQARFFGMLPP